MLCLAHVLRISFSATVEAMLVSAALMQGKGRVLAFDKDPRRLQRLEANAAATGADCITAHLADFLQLPLATSPEFRRVCWPSQLHLAHVWHIYASTRLRCFIRMIALMRCNAPSS